MRNARRQFIGGMAAAGSAALSGCAFDQGPKAPVRPAGRTDGGPVIDLHAHWYAPEYLSILEKEANGQGAKIGRNARGLLTLTAPELNTVFQPQYTDLPTRLKEMDAAGVDIHALSLTSPMVYWAPPALGMKLSQAFNDGLVKAVAEYPKRFIGLATLPMQAPALAIEELQRIAKFPAIKGVYLATHVNGKNLDEKEFFPVYAKCEELGLQILLHPVAPIGMSTRLTRYWLNNFLGNPYDTGIAAASLMFGGVMDAFPKLEVVLPHAGGTFPALIGRMDHGVTVRPETKHMTRPPSTYLRRFYYDTISHHVPLMRYLISLVGVDRIVLGSDHPADMSYEQPVRFVDKLDELPARDRNLILGGNAQRLLKITG
jgi:aminocarboxymuconate-semialdehyde decarboxylase